MAETKQATSAGNQPGAGDTARGQAAKEVPGAMRSELGAAQQDAVQTAAKTAGQAGERGAEALREGGEAAADVSRRAGEAAERGGAALGETARRGMQAAAEQQSRFVQGAAQEMEKTGRSLAGMVEEAAAGMRSLMSGPGFQSGGFQEAQQALAKLVQSVMQTNMRFADELLRRTGPSTVVDLQRQFLREYFDALAQGGTLLLRAARQAAEDSLRPLEQQVGARGDRQGQGGHGRVADVMSKDVKLASPEDTVQQAARVMSEQDTGVLPVGENDRLVGMVTDRDLAVRALAAGKDPSKTKLREVMSGEPRYVFADDSIESAASSMAEQQVKRMPVLDRDKRLVGIVSVGDLAREALGGPAQQALSGISRPGGPHNQNGAASG
jgi:CBS domain-containing protein